MVTLIMHHCNMEEMVILHCGSFAALGEWAKAVTLLLVIQKE